MHRPIDPPTPWLKLLALAALGAIAYATAWSTSPENRATRDLILTTIQSSL